MSEPGNLPIYSPEGLLTAALIEFPKVYPEIRWVDPDLFEWPNVRVLYIAADHLLKQHPDATGDQLLRGVKNLLIEYKKTDALRLLEQMVGASVAIGDQAPRYARQLWERAQDQSLRDAAVKMAQVTASESMTLQQKMELIEQTWMEALTKTHGDPGWQPIEGLATLDEFMADTDDTHDWVIPGMLEREERIMVIAPEKAGKSVLTRQFVLMLASGRHPLKHEENIPPMTTLMIDLENPRPLAARDFRRQVSSMEDLWQVGSKAFIWHKPGGMHLGDGSDRVLLRNVVDRVEPDFLAVSPIYKAYQGLDQSWEQQAQGVQYPLDRLRGEFHCAIWMEHHAPWGEKGFARDIRAIGSSRWARWLDYTVQLWPQGQRPYQRLLWRSEVRDERKMSPYAIERGQPGEPSWVPVWDKDTDYDLQRHEAEM